MGMPPARLGSTNQQAGRLGKSSKLGIGAANLGTIEQRKQARHSFPVSTCLMEHT